LDALEYAGHQLVKIIITLLLWWYFRFFSRFHSLFFASETLFSPWNNNGTDTHWRSCI